MKMFGGILINVENPAFKRERPYDIPVVGKSMTQWVGLAFPDRPFCAVCGYDEDFVAAIKEHLDMSCRYTVVLFSDTPLMQKKTVLEAVRLIKAKQVRALNLTRGWVFETEYLASIDCLPELMRYYLSEEEDFMTCRDFASLSLVTQIMRQRIIVHHMACGVHIEDPAATYIEGDVQIGENVTVGVGNHLKGRTVIGKDVYLGERNSITDSVVADGARVVDSTVCRAFIGERTEIGPNANLREGTIVESDCRVGSFVELKNVKLGSGTKVAHLSYLGDCETGKDCNVGGGVITANFDGKRKHKTVLGNHVFVGSNSTLIAPLKLADNSFVAAGSTLTDDVEPNALAIARARQTTLAGRTKW